MKAGAISEFILNVTDMLEVMAGSGSSDAATILSVRVVHQTH